MVKHDYRRNLRPEIEGPLRRRARPSDTVALYLWLAAAVAVVVAAMVLR